MERPVSFSAEDIRDEKVRMQFSDKYHPPIRSIRSKFYVPFLPLSVKILFLVSTWVRMASLDILRTTPFRTTLSALLSLLLPFGSITQDGKASHLSSRLEKVCTPSFINAKMYRCSLCGCGAALNESKVEVRIQFKDVVQGIFKNIARNELVIRIQPSEAIYLKMNTKLPGLQMRAMPTEMDLTYKRRFTDAKIPEAYESLILDAIKGDHSNFVRDDELDVAWKVGPDSHFPWH